jgi:hypothetical protein
LKKPPSGGFLLRCRFSHGSAAEVSAQLVDQLGGDALAVFTHVCATGRGEHGDGGLAAAALSATR